MRRATLYQHSSCSPSFSHINTHTHTLPLTSIQLPSPWQRRQSCKNRSTAITTTLPNIEFLLLKKATGTHSAKEGLLFITKWDASKRKSNRLQGFTTPVILKLSWNKQNQKKSWEINGKIQPKWHFCHHLAHYLNLYNRMFIAAASFF